MNVYLFRAPESQLKPPPGAIRCSTPTVETQPGRHGIRSPNGYGQMRVVLDGDPPPDTGVSTWRLIGHMAVPTSTRYTPLERCKRNHPPLRYLSSGGCVYCNSLSQPLATPRLRLQVPHNLLPTFDDTVKALGWKIDVGKVRDTEGRRLVAVEASGPRSDAIATAIAMGWEVSLW